MSLKLAKVKAESKWRSRKMWFGAASILTLGYAATLGIPFPTYEAFAGAVVAICGMVIIGNVASKWVGGKIPVVTKADISSSEESPTPTEENQQSK